MRNCMKKFSGQHCYHLFLKNFHEGTVLCKITTRSILRVVPEHFLQRMRLTGGKRLLSHPISTLLRTCGTSLKSTFVEKLSHAQKKN